MQCLIWRGGIVINSYFEGINETTLLMDSSTPLFFALSGIAENGYFRFIVWFLVIGHTSFQMVSPFRFRFHPLKAPFCKLHGTAENRYFGKLWFDSIECRSSERRKADWQLQTVFVFVRVFIGYQIPHCRRELLRLVNEMSQVRVLSGNTRSSVGRALMCSLFVFIGIF